ncbi:hypothetical protein PUNSTDRAFT_146897, partial [Punctularia strigosozonata HHB-11173 SS5]
MLLYVSLTALILALLLPSSVAQTVTVSAGDPRITYSGSWSDQDNGGHRFSGNPGDGITFTFQGSSISYLSRHNFNGGVASVSVDGGSSSSVDESAGTTNGEDPVEAVLYTKSGLDGSKQHTFQLTITGVGQYGGSYVEVYGLEFAEGGAISSSTTQAGSGQQTQTQTQTQIQTQTQTQTQTHTQTQTQTTQTQPVQSTETQQQQKTRSGIDSLLTTTTTNAAGQTVTLIISSSPASTSNSSPSSSSS